MQRYFAFLLFFLPFVLRAQEGENDFRNTDHKRIRRQHIREVHVKDSTGSVFMHIGYDAAGGLRYFRYVIRQGDSSCTYRMCFDDSGRISEYYCTTSARPMTYDWCGFVPGRGALVFQLETNLSGQYYATFESWNPADSMYVAGEARNVEFPKGVAADTFAVPIETILSQVAWSAARKEKKPYTLAQGEGWNYAAWPLTMAQDFVLEEFMQGGELLHGFGDGGKSGILSRDAATGTWILQQQRSR